MLKPKFEDGMWWAIETMISIDDGAGKLLFTESHLTKEQAIKLSQNSGSEASKEAIKFLDEWVWNRK